MGIRDTFAFDSDKYARKLNDKEKCSDRQLKKKHHQKCLAITTRGCGISAGIGLAPFTLGITLFSSAYSWRQMIVLEKQKKLIEEECRARMIPEPRERKRDIAIGSAVGVATMGLSAAIPFGVDSLAGEAVVGAASTASTAFGTAVDHLTLHAAELANAASQGGHGLYHGVQETLTSQAHHLVHQGTVGASELYVPFQHLPCDASVAGIQAGALGTMKVESFVGQLAVGYALDRAGTKIATPSC